MSYCVSPYSYQRRPSRVVAVGKVAIGGANPIRVQSMITCDTMDTAKSMRHVAGANARWHRHGSTG